MSSVPIDLHYYYNGDYFFFLSKAYCFECRINRHPYSPTKEIVDTGYTINSIFPRDYPQLYLVGLPR